MGHMCTRCCLCYQLLLYYRFSSLLTVIRKLYVVTYLASFNNKFFKVIQFQALWTYYILLKRNVMVLGST